MLVYLLHDSVGLHTERDAPYSICLAPEWYGDATIRERSYTPDLKCGTAYSRNSLGDWVHMRSTADQGNAPLVETE